MPRSLMPPALNDLKARPFRMSNHLSHTVLGMALIPLPLAALAEAPAVLVDTPALHSIAASVMAGAATPDLLLPPGASPHDFALRPSDANALAQADLIFWVGPGLTPWLSEPLAALGENATRIALLDTDGWSALPLRDWDDGHDHGPATDHDDHADDHGHAEAHKEDEVHAEAHEEDHDHAEAHADAGGHDHSAAAGTTDPHAWLDPQVASVWAMTMAEALGASDPANAALYRQNATALSEANEALIRDLSAQLGPFAGQGFVVPHDAFQYFEARFGMPASGTVSLSNAQTPTPAALAALRDRMQTEGIICILTDPQTNPAWAGIVAEGTGATLVPVDAEGATLPAGPALYAALLRSVADALETCLSAD